MTLTITHAKTNNVPDWTQADLDTVIAGGAPPAPAPGTLLADITLPSDWNDNHQFTGILDVANGGTGTATPSLVAGTNVTITGTWPNQTIASTGGGGSSAFNAITSGTNTTAAMVVGSGASISVTGTGTNAATSAPASGLTGSTLAAGVTGSSLTSVGTIVTGVWNGTDIAVADGGTGASNASDARTNLGVGVIGTLSTIAATITCVFDGLGSALVANSKVYLEIPFAMTITGWTIIADQSGSCVVDVWKDTYANYPPVVGDSIAGSEKPTLSSAAKNQDLTLSTWTTSVSAGDTMVFNVDSATTVTKVTVVLRGTRVA